LYISFDMVRRPVDSDIRSYNIRERALEQYEQFENLKKTSSYFPKYIIINYNIINEIG